MLLNHLFKQECYLNDYRELAIFSEAAKLLVVFLSNDRSVEL